MNNNQIFKIGDLVHFTVRPDLWHEGDESLDEDWEAHDEDWGIIISSHSSPISDVTTFEVHWVVAGLSRDNASFLNQYCNVIARA